MASVNEYLKKLLYQYDCVVVPEFGAFLTHYQPAAYNEASGLFIPPRGRVAFNEALRLDDGILANYIMLHEPLTREGAQRHISKFVDTLRKEVEISGHYELDGVGTFSRNDEMKLQFDPSFRHNFFGEAFGMNALAVQPVNRPTAVETPIEAVPITVPGPVLVREADVTYVPLRPARLYWRIAATILLVGTLGLISYFSVIQPDQPLQSSFNPANLFKISSADSPKTSNVTPIEAKKVAIVVPSNESTIIAQPTVMAESIPASKPEPATPLLTETIEKETTTTSVPPTSVAISNMNHRAEHHYTVIAGVFSNKEKALPLVNYLHKVGYADAYIMVQGKKALRYKVAAVGSENKLEAQSHIPAISKIIGSTAWIYTK